MNAEQTTTIITAIFQGGGILLFLYYYIRSLKNRITSLKDTIQAQEKTLSVMEKRITETEKVGNIYKNLIADLPKDLENYRAVISQTKDNVIFELRNMNKEIARSFLVQYNIRHRNKYSSLRPAFCPSIQE